MPDPRALTPARLIRLRAMTRWQLLATLAATVAVAVMTVLLLLVVTADAAVIARAAAPAGTPDDEVTAALAEGTAALGSVLPSLLLTVVVVAATAVAQLGRLVAAGREGETETARARGLSRRQAVTMNAAEAATVALVGGVTGAALAVLAAATTGGADAAEQVLSHLWVPAVAAVVLGAVLVAAMSRRSSTRRRGARITTAAAVVLLAAAAVLCVWQLGFARPGGFDPVVALAPTVILLAGAVAALALFGAIARLVAAPAVRWRGFDAALGARQVARRLPLTAVAVLLIALAVGQTVLAATFSATWTAAATNSAALRVGADLRVDLSPQSASPADVRRAADLDGATAAAAAVIETLEFGDDEASLVALPRTQVPAVVATAGGRVDPAALVARLSDRGEGVTAAEPLGLGGAATGLTLTVTAEWTGADVSDALQPLAIVLDARGTPAALPLGVTSVTPDGVSAEATLPDGTAPWSLAALVMRVGPTPSPPVGTVSIATAAAVDGEVLDLSGSVAFDGADREAVLWVAEGGAAADGDGERLRVVASSAFAERFGVAAGDSLEYRVAGTGRRGDVVIADIVPAVPGASRSVALFALSEDLLTSSLQRGTSFAQPGSVWVSGPATPDQELSAVLDDRPVRAAVPGVAERVVGALVPAWWIAVVGTAALALIATVAIVQTLALTRRAEPAILRAAGVPARQQARIRARELAASLGGAGLLGLVVGALIAVVLAPPLVRATTPGILPVVVSLETGLGSAAAVIGSLAAGLAAVIGAAAISVRREARSAVVGEEAR